MAKLARSRIDITIGRSAPSKAHILLSGIVDLNRRPGLLRRFGRTQVKQHAIGVAKPDAFGRGVERSGQKAYAALAQLRLGLAQLMGTGAPRHPGNAFFFARNEIQLILVASGAAKHHAAASGLRLKAHGFVKSRTLLKVWNRQRDTLQ